MIVFKGGRSRRFGTKSNTWPKIDPFLKLYRKTSWNFPFQKHFIRQHFVSTPFLLKILLFSSSFRHFFFSHLKIEKSVSACMRESSVDCTHSFSRRTQNRLWKTKKRAPKHSRLVFASKISRKQVKCSGTVVLLDDSGLIDFQRVRNDAVPNIFFVDW